MKQTNKLSAIWKNFKSNDYRKKNAIKYHEKLCSICLQYNQHEKKNTLNIKNRALFITNTVMLQKTNKNKQKDLLPFLIIWLFWTGETLTELNSVYKMISFSKNKGQITKTTF